jgi:hypothetical protein
MSHQRIRFITILTDLLLINAGFALAYVVRYQWQWFLPVSEQFFEPYGRYLSQQLGAQHPAHHHVYPGARLAAQARRVLGG